MKNYILAITTILIIVLTVSLQSVFFEGFIYQRINKKLHNSGWELKVNSSKINLFSTSVLSNTSLLHRSGSIINIESISFNFGLFSSIVGSTVLDLLIIEGVDATYIDENVSTVNEIEKNDIHFDIPYHIKSFFVDGRLTPAQKNKELTFNFIMGGSFNGKQNPFIKFDLMRIFLEDDINVDCNLERMKFGYDSSSYSLKEIKGTLFNLPIAGDIHYRLDKKKVDGSIDLKKVNIPKELFSLLPLKTKFSNFNGRLNFDTDFNYFRGEVKIDNKLGLDMNGGFFMKNENDFWTMRDFVLNGENSHLKINGSWDNEEKISCFMNLSNLDLSRWVKNQKPTQLSGLFIMDANLTEQMALDQIDMTIEMVEEKLFNQGEISIHGLFNYQDSLIKTIDPVMLLIEDSYLTIDGEGDFSSNSIELLIDMEKADIDLVNNFLPGNFLSGKATGKMKISGDTYNPSAIAELFCEDISIGDFQLESIELNSKITVSDSIPNGFIDIKAGQGMWRNMNFESGTVSATLDNQSFVIDNCHFKSKNDFLQLSGSFDGFKNYKIERMQLAYKDNYLVNTRPVDFSIEDSIYQIKPFEFHINDGAMEGVITGKDHMKGQFKMSNFDSEILTQFFDDKRLKLSGIIFGEIQISTAKNNFDLDVDITLKKGKYMDEPFDEMILSCFYNDGVLHLDNISMTREGSLGINASGIVPTVNNNNNNIAIALESNFYNMPLKFVHRFMPEFYKIDGLATGTVYLSGSPKKTKFSYNIKVEEALFDLINLGNVFSKGKYDGSKLNVDLAEAKLKDGFVTSSGVIPFDFNIGSENFGSLYEQDSIDLRSIAKLRNLFFLSPYLSDLDSASGEFIIKLNLNGEAGSIVRSGNMNIKDGKIHTLLVSDPIFSINGFAEMKDNQLDIQNIKAILYHENGKYKKPMNENTYINGFIDFKNFFDPNYDLQITAKNSSYKLLAYDISGQSNLDISISGKDTITIDGIIETYDANIFYEFTNEDVGTAIDEDISKVMSYNLNIPFRGAAIFQNSQIDAKVRGELNLSQLGHQETDFGGQIIVEDGYVFFYKDKFKDLNGELTFDNKGFNPTIDVNAYTVIDNEQIDLNIKGGVDDLDIILESSSSFSESDILELLILGKRLEDEQLLSTGFGNQTVSILGALLENQLEKNLKESNAAMMNYVDDINISGAAGLLQGSDEDFEVSAEKQIGQRTFLNLSYKRSFSLNEDQSQVGVEYKLNRHFSVVGNVDDEGRLNLKYRYKYAY